MPEDGVYTINLGKVLLSPDNRRSMRAINMIREFARRHMKAAEVKIDEEVSHQVWARGIRSPPRRLRVRMSRTGEGAVLVSRYDAPGPEQEPAEPAPAAGPPGGAAAPPPGPGPADAEPPKPAAGEAPEPAAKAPGPPKPAAGEAPEPAAKEPEKAPEPAAKAPGPDKPAAGEAPEPAAKEPEKAPEPAAKEPEKAPEPPKPAAKGGAGKKAKPAPEGG